MTRDHPNGALIDNYPCNPQSYPLASRTRLVQSDSPETRIHHGDDDLRLLGSLPPESVDLVYLDPPFFHMDWMAATLEETQRILKPTGALFLICDESVGHYVRILLDEFVGPQDADDRMACRKVSSGSEHHYLFHFHKSVEVTRHGHLYTVVCRQRKGSRSLVAFSFVQGRRVRRTSASDPAKSCLAPQAPVRLRSSAAKGGRASRRSSV